MPPGRASRTFRLTVRSMFLRSGALGLLLLLREHWALAPPMATVVLSRPTRTAARLLQQTSTMLLGSSFVAVAPKVLEGPQLTGIAERFWLHHRGPQRTTAQLIIGQSFGEMADYLLALPRIPISRAAT